MQGVDWAKSAKLLFIFGVSLFEIYAKQIN